MTSRDMSAPNWARTVKRAERLAAELRKLDVQVTFPPNFHLPPSKRYAQQAQEPITGTAVKLTEHGPELHVARGRHPLL